MNGESGDERRERWRGGGGGRGTCGGMVDLYGVESGGMEARLFVVFGRSITVAMGLSG